MQNTLKYYCILNATNMIVHCRSCAMRYHLDDSVLGSKGCQVRCTACGYIWHQSPPPAKNMLVPQGEESLPVHKGFSRGTKIALFTVSLLLASSGSFFLGRNSFGSLGPWIDGCIELWHNSEKKPDLEITSFSIQSTDEGNVVCQGSLRNLSNRTINSPKILILRNDGYGKTAVQKKEHILKDTNLEPGQVQSFSLTLPASSCAFITAMIK